MPIRLPNLDDRSWEEIRDEALRRIPVHTPEWTNFNSSDPGVTLIEVFAFMTESLLYRSNLIPERNRLKFLSLLGIPLHPGSAARSLVTFHNARGPLETLTLNSNMQVQAGSIPFYTTMGLDVLPIEAQIFTKRELKNPPPAMRAYYRRLYKSYIDAGLSPVTEENPPLYEATPFQYDGTSLLTTDGTVDGTIWVALLARSNDTANIEDVREQIKGRIINLGLVPIPEDIGRRLVPGGMLNGAAMAPIRYEVPQIPPSGALPGFETGARQPEYTALSATTDTDIRQEPGIVQIVLPDDVDQLRLWTNLDPLEAGVGNFPPMLDDERLNARIITWLRISAPGGAPLRFLWLGLNAVPARQRTQVRNELLPNGTGQPDQVMYLSQTPVIPGSLSLMVSPPGGETNTWTEIDDLLEAGPEVSKLSPQQSPGTPLPEAKPSRVFMADYESGSVQFGDGHFGKRLPPGATVRANYDVSVGAAGNVAVGAISSSPALPAGIRVNNPVPAWGASDPETVADGEKQITSRLMDQERCTDVRSFKSLTMRIPGVGRADVLPAYNPALGSSEHGDAPGAVTLMILPGHDPQHPKAPLPDQNLLDAICGYLEPRRLVTTEVFLRPPLYKDIWVSVGLRVSAGLSVARVTRDVQSALEQFLSPLPLRGDVQLPPQQTLFTEGNYSDMHQGYPLGKNVLRLELLAVANRVEGVQLVNNLVLYNNTGNSTEEVPINGLELPRLAGIAVEAGDPPDKSQIPNSSGTPPTDSTEAPPAFAPVPVAPEKCD